MNERKRKEEFEKKRINEYINSDTESYICMEKKKFWLEFQLDHLHTRQWFEVICPVRYLSGQWIKTTFAWKFIKNKEEEKKEKKHVSYPMNILKSHLIRSAETYVWGSLCDCFVFFILFLFISFFVCPLAKHTHITHTHTHMDIHYNYTEHQCIKISFSFLFFWLSVNYAETATCMCVCMRVYISVTLCIHPSFYAFYFVVRPSLYHTCYVYIPSLHLHCAWKFNFKWFITKG